jgi:hypothetical protein
MILIEAQMTISRFGCYALSFGAALGILAGCGGSQSPVAAPAVVPAGVARSLYAEQSVLAPENMQGALLYVGGNNNQVTVYSYPDGKLVATLKNPHFSLPSGECVDKAGDVFITNLGTAQIFEYAHGGKTPIATLKAAAKNPSGCSVDLNNGNLAVTTQGSGSGGNVAIYAHARGTPKTYTDPSLYEYFYCGYDNAGNLFVEGLTPTTFTFQLAELPNGKSKFTNISLNQSIGYPGGVQWDGKYVVVGDAYVSNLYEFAISGTTGTLQSTTNLKGANDVQQFWIHGHAVIAADHGDSQVTFYRYRAGGNPTKTITQGIEFPDGLTLSVAQK